jgi:putative glutamine amidotransferase
MKKKIGISFSKTNFQNYWNWFEAEMLSGDIDLVELSFLKNNFEDIGLCDGFVLSGGVDIEPSLYGGARVYDNMEQTFQQDRDQFEEKIFRHAESTAKPLLGICRGLQLVNVLQGGKLIQDLGAGNEIHRKAKEDKEHPVRIFPGTRLFEIIGERQGQVNSAHHQAVDPKALGENLEANAVSPDGVVEGIEFRDKKGKGFMICVQWHPERMKGKDKDPFSQKLKQQFLEAITN